MTHRVIHHIDGNPHDNSLGNLVIMNVDDNEARRAKSLDERSTGRGGGVMRPRIIDNTTALEAQVYELKRLARHRINWVER